MEIKKKLSPQSEDSLIGTWSKEDGNSIEIRRENNDYVFQHNAYQEYIQIHQAGQYYLFDIAKWEYGHRTFIRCNVGELTEITHDSTHAHKWVKQQRN
ncbi:UNKNOWN [Stylonychia lemnae]|uniref:DUF3876 domain-containing protein n=1 Tax=Stylonychia lemnae TaxID=5949 RepID=A0A078ARM5_STYLE|nr:UNKNOWN [Stylonychia lemnae]|eukprot:CDW84631.1 UNKNOWN [Stylonychia lemnae]